MDGCGQICGCWESGPRREQQVLLTTEPSLHLPRLGLKHLLKKFRLPERTSKEKLMSVNKG